MKVEQTKSLIREIAPGVIVIGNNPFAPVLKLDEIAMKADILGGGVLTDGSLDNITGESLDYDSAEIGDAVFANRPTALGVPMMVSGDLDYPLSLITTDVTDLELNIESLEDKVDTEETTRAGDVQSIDLRVSAEEVAREDDVTSLDMRTSIEEVARGDDVTSLDMRTSIEEVARGDDVASLDDRMGIEEIARGDNVASLDDRVEIEEVTRGGNVQSIDDRFLDLPAGGGTGISEAQATDIAKRWALILG